MEQITVKEYWEQIDKMLSSIGYQNIVTTNPNSNNCSRIYIQEPKLDGSENKIMVEVRLDWEFKFKYTNMQMCAKLETDYMSPIYKKMHFNKMLEKFKKSVDSLRDTWEDY